MEKGITKIYIILLIAGIVIAVYYASLGKVSIYNRKEAQPAEIWDDRMEQSVDGDSCLYRTVLPQEEIADKVIGYNSAHMKVEVSIGGEKVYSLQTAEGSFVKTTGYFWNFIAFTQEDAGKELVFRVTPIYEDCRPRGDFYYGERSAVERLIVRERAVRLVITLLILLIAVLLFLYDILIVRKERENKSLLHFTIFAGILGVWYMCESQIMELFLPWRILIVNIDHLTLMLMPIAFLLFIRQMYRSKRHWLWNVSCYLNCAVVIVRLFLQVIGVCDLRETLILTHAAIGYTAVTVVALSIYEIVTGSLTKQAKLNIFCVMAILLFVVMELVEYRMSNKGIPFGSIGFLFYISVMGSVTVRESRRMMMQLKENELYRKLAFTDELTGLYNRAAFNRDMENRRAPDKEKTVYRILPTVLFMFDLNDLKKCNDGYGHEYGDRYIKMVSGVIRQVFGTVGNCYRIGGDEFCSIMDYTSQEDIEERYRRFLEEIRKKDEQSFVVPVSVAAGYAVYDPEKDDSLEASMKRADEMMYENKQEIKRRREAQRMAMQGM